MNKYLYEMRKARMKPKVQELALNIMLKCPESTPLKEVMDFIDSMIERESKVFKLAPTPEEKLINISYK